MRLTPYPRVGTIRPARSIFYLFIFMAKEGTIHTSEHVNNPPHGEIVRDRAQGRERGTILLIHGTAPQNIDGQCPRLRRKIDRGEAYTHHFKAIPKYQQLARALNRQGWCTVRYTRPGVFLDEIDFQQYQKTDLNCIMDQLKAIWGDLPADKPRIIYAWSGGSVHALQLPLAQADALIMLGAIGTRRTDIGVINCRTYRQRLVLKFKILLIPLLRHLIRPYALMPPDDLPWRRFFDEHDLLDNWTYLRDFPQLPVLILHGDRDRKVPLSQAMLWQEKLPHHRIDTVIKAGANHTFGIGAHVADMEDLADRINSWLGQLGW